MENTLTQQKPKTAAQYKSVIEEMHTEMQRLNESSRHYQVEIERDLAETAVLKTETRALLSRMGVSF